MTNTASKIQNTIGIANGISQTSQGQTSAQKASGLAGLISNIMAII